jgi:hypothetical protein
VFEILMNIELCVFILFFCNFLILPVLGDDGSISELTNEAMNLRKSIEDSNYLNFILIAISLSTAIGTAIFTGIQAGLLRKQSSLTEKEVKNRIRPILGRFQKQTQNLKSRVEDESRFSNDICFIFKKS